MGVVSGVSGAPVGGAEMRAAADEAPGSRRERRKEELRQRIYEAALTLFRRQGIAATTIRQIAQAAGVGVGTFFNYFAGKEAVLAEFGGEQIERVEALITQPDFLALPTRTRIEAILRLLVEGVETEPVLLRGVVEVVLHSPELFSGERRRFVALADLLVGLLREGQARGEIRADADICSAVQLLVGSYAVLTLDWVEGGSDSANQAGAVQTQALLPQLLAQVALLWRALEPDPIQRSQQAELLV